MDFASKCNDRVTIVRQVDGLKYENLPALISSNIIFIPDANVPITPDDIVLRKLPSGIEERFIVTEPGFQRQNHGMPAHYQVRYRRERQKPIQDVGFNVHINGNNSRVNILSKDNSINNINHHVNMAKLASELEQLREILLLKARTSEHYAIIGRISEAEIAAKEEDNTKIQQALSALRSGAEWVLSIAREIGVQIAVAEIVRHISI